MPPTWSFVGSRIRPGPRSWLRTVDSKTPSRASFESACRAPCTKHMATCGMPRLDAIGLVVEDMAEAMDFYRKLGLEFTVGTEADGHVEASGPGGLRIMFDTEESVK